MKIRKILLIFSISVIIIISISILTIAPISVIRRQPLKTVLINPSVGENTKKCLKEIVNCNNDDECQQNCIENSQGIQMKCTQLPRYNANQESTVGKTQNICAPAKAESNCDAKHGGVLTWTGFPDINNMNFNCFCTYPNLASGPSCSLNPDVCAGGTYSWDVTDPNKSDPSKATCTCDANSILIMDTLNNVPKCVPKTFNNNFNETSTASFYNNDYRYGSTDFEICPKGQTYKTNSRSKSIFQSCNPNENDYIFKCSEKCQNNYTSIILTDDCVCNF